MHHFSTLRLQRFGCQKRSIVSADCLHACRSVISFQFQFLPTGQIASQHYGAVLELEIATPAKVEEAELMHSVLLRSDLIIGCMVSGCLSGNQTLGALVNFILA